MPTLLVMRPHERTATRCKFADGSIGVARGHKGPYVMKMKGKPRLGRFEQPNATPVTIITTPVPGVYLMTFDE